MIKLQKNILTKNNGYMADVGWTWLAHAMNERNWEFFNERPIRMIYTLLDYKPLGRDTDIFKFLRPKMLHYLRNKKNVYFVLDASLEGFGPINYPIIEVLYKNCKLHNISPAKIIYATSNLYDARNNHAYCLEHGIKTSIKIYQSSHFRYATGQNFRNEISVDFTLINKWNAEKYYTKRKQEFEQNYTGKYFLSLSRVVRTHRTIGHYLLYKHGIDKYGLISQDDLVQRGGDLQINWKHKEARNWIETDHHENYDEFIKWAKTLPLTIDTEDFATNHGPNNNFDLYNKTLFEIVNETDAYGYNNTQLFYSEKTFKPMINCMPFIIHGQPGANHHLKEMGFKIFDEMFDYSFDFEQDHKKRYIMMIEMLKGVIEKLNAMSKREQLDWRFQCRDKLLFNLKKVAMEKKDDIQLEKLLNAIYQECGY